MRNDHRAVADFEALNAHLVDEAQVIVQFIAHVERFKQGSAAIDIKTRIMIELGFLSHVGRYNGSAKAQFQEVHKVAPCFD